MDTPDLDPTRSAQALAQDIEAYVAEATRRMAAGDILELGELDNAVDALCERIMNQRADEAQLFIPRLELLREKLDVLQGHLNNAKETVKAELDAASARQKASRAYRPPAEEQK